MGKLNPQAVVDDSISKVFASVIAESEVDGQPDCDPVLNWDTEDSTQANMESQVTMTQSEANDQDLSDTELVAPFD